jgi:hypothetical protein
MLFEELMMQLRYDVFRDTAVTNLPSGDDVTSRDYIVSWGQRGRIGEADIKTRVEFVTKRILPEFDSSTLIANLPQPIAMTEGNNWLDNLFISPIGISKSKKVKAVKASNISIELYQEVNKQRPYYHKDLPKS